MNSYSLKKLKIERSPNGLLYYKMITTEDSMHFWVDKPDQEIKTIINATFPKYNGRKIKVSTDVPSRLDSYWDGGSKDTFSFYHLDERKSFQLPTNHPAFEPGNPSKLNSLPNRVVIVMHSYFCGKDLGITIYANSDDMTPLLPKQADITEDEKIVLKYTREYKNTYGGRTNIRYSEAKYSTGITVEGWETAKNTLISKGLLNKGGAITVKKNALN